MLAKNWIWGTVLVVTAPAHAAITYLERDTELTATGVTCIDPSCHSTGMVQDGTTGFGAYSQSLTYYTAEGINTATAQQTSSLTTSGIFMTVTNQEAFGINLAKAVSTLVVKFVLDEAMNFSFIGRGASYYDAGKSQMRLTGQGVDIKEFMWPFGSGSAADWRVESKGTLAAGEYQLFLLSEANGPRNPAYSFMDVKLNLSPVPLPAALPLLLSGLLSLAGVKRLRQRSTISTSSGDSV